MPFISLPVEILNLVSDHLPEPDLNSLAKTSRHLYHVYDSILWTLARDNERVRAVRTLPRAGIIRATTTGNVDAIRKFISMDVDISPQHPHTSLTPLPIAARGGHTRIVKLLLDNGAVMDATIRRDSVVRGALLSEDREAIIEILLRHDIPLSEFDHSRFIWHECPPSVVRGLRKHFTASIVAQHCKSNDLERNFYEPFLAYLLFFAVLDNDADDVRTILLVRGPEGGNDDLSRDGIYFGAAVAHGYEEIVRILLDAGADPNTVTSYHAHVPVMFLALQYGRKEVARLLYENGALLNSPTQHREFAVPPTLGAVASGDPAMLDFVLDLGENVLEVLKEYRNGLACFACFGSFRYGYEVILPEEKPRSAEILRRLYELGIDPNEGELFSRSPLSHAIAKKWTDGVRYLLQLGANANATSNRRSPLLKAIMQGSLEIVELILQHGADPDGIDRQRYREPASLCSGFPKYTSYLPLHHAIRFGSHETVRVLVEAGASVTSLNRKQPLQVAVLHSAKTVTAEMLLRHGAPIDAKDPVSGTTPLHNAVMKTNLEFVQLFLRHGADLHQTDKEGHTALHLSCAVGSVEIACILLEHGADIAHKALFCNTALHIAASKSPEVATLLLAHNAAVNVIGDSGKTPLHFAVEKSNHKTISALLSHGALPDIPNGKNETALHIAARYGNMPNVLELLQHNASVNLQDKKGATPLFQAVSSQHVEVVQVLSDHGADLTIADWKGNTALNYARYERILEILRGTP